MVSKANGNETQPNKTKISTTDCILPEKANPYKSRRALVKATGINPKGMVCCHLCPNDSKHGGCINPAHLYWGTPSQNRYDHYQSDRADETRRKLSQLHKGKPKSEEVRRKLSEAMKGKQHSEETKRRMSDAQKHRRLKSRDPHPRPNPLPPGRL